MATNETIRRERRNDRKEKDDDSDGGSEQIEGGARKDRVSLSSKAGVFIRRLDEPLIDILQGGLQKQKATGGDTGQEVGELDMEVSAKDGGEAVKSPDNQGDGAGREGNVDIGRRAGS